MMQWHAKWIWTATELPPMRCHWVVARRRFSLEGAFRRPKIRITADSRYVLYVNGHRVGNGPVRSWPWAWHYDTYDLGGFVTAGDNDILVLVMHYGAGNFQYVPAPPGLVAQVEWQAGDEERVVGTDRDWDMAVHPGYDPRTPRISCQQAWVEHFDATKQEIDWRPAVEIDPSPERAPERLIPRPIPYLTEEPLHPVRVHSTRLVVAPQQICTYDLRPNLLPGDREANLGVLQGFVATVVKVPEPVSVTIEAQSGVKGKLRVNGEDPLPLKPTHPWARGWRVRADLRAGENLLLWDVSGHYHEWSASYVVDSPEPLTPAVPCELGSRFATLGPVEDGETRDRIWQAASTSELEGYRGLAAPVDAGAEYSAHVFDAVTLAEELPGEPVIDGPDRLCMAVGEATVIHPAPDGADIELVLDFGRMTVGWTEFEIEAEAGVILDWCGFESIQEGILDYTWGCNNVMRYTTSEGLQRYTSVVRRGFRYLSLTVRGLRSPLRIRRIGTLLNTYPVVQKGAFRCNDWALNRIWEVGRYTARLCNEDTMVDCPTYEQTLWVGDARNESLINLVAFGNYPLTRYCLELVAESLKRSPLVESQVPSGWESILTAWSFLWVLACEEYYRYTGDEALLRQVYPAIRAQGANCADMLNEQGLLEIEAWNMLDWAPMDTPNSGIVTHQNAWLVEAYRRSAALARALGEDADAARFEEWAQRVRRGLNAALWDDQARAYRDCIHADGTPSRVISQQTNTVMLLCGCVPEEREEAVRRIILDPPEGVVRAGSPFVMFFVLEALAEMGEHELVVDWIRERWRMMIDRGATTFWEVFPGFDPGGRWTRSHCHAWSAAPTYFLSIYQLGVRPVEVGFTKALIAPIPAGLTWAKGTMPTPHGPLSVDWAVSSDAFRIAVALPEAVSAEIVSPCLPGGYETACVEGGPGSVRRLDDGGYRVELPAGGRAQITFARNV